MLTLTAITLASRLQPKRSSTGVRDDLDRSLPRPGGRVIVAKEDRGFASMDRMKQREIASKGGKAAHQKGTAREWTSEEARDAGRKGGIASHQRRREQMGGPNSEVEDTPALGSDDSMRNSSPKSWSRANRLAR